MESEIIFELEWEDADTGQLRYGQISPKIPVDKRKNRLYLTKPEKGLVPETISITINILKEI